MGQLGTTTTIFRSCPHLKFHPPQKLPECLPQNLGTFHAQLLPQALIFQRQGRQVVPFGVVRLGGSLIDPTAVLMSRRSRQQVNK